MLNVIFSVIKNSFTIHQIIDIIMHSWTQKTVYNHFQHHHHSMSYYSHHPAFLAAASHHPHPHHHAGQHGHHGHHPHAARDFREAQVSLINIFSHHSFREIATRLLQYFVLKNVKLFRRSS